MSIITIQAEAKIPTDFGTFTMYAISESPDEWRPELVLVAEGTRFDEAVNLRIHSECITGEVFHSRKCECGPQLSTAMEIFGENGGIIIYLRQEGRNIGIINKLRAYALQEQGHDTVQANLSLGLPADGRDFTIVGDILAYFGVKKVRLFTNNPEKLSVLDEDDRVVLLDRVSLQMEALPENEGYLETKKSYFKHLLD